MLLWHLLLGRLEGLNLLRLQLQLLLLLDHLPLSWDLGQTGVEVIGDLDGINLVLADGGTDAIGPGSGQLGLVGVELGLGGVGQRVGGVQQLQVLVELSGKYFKLNKEVITMLM